MQHPSNLIVVSIAPQQRVASYKTRVSSGLFPERRKASLRREDARAFPVFFWETLRRFEARVGREIRFLVTLEVLGSPGPPPIKPSVSEEYVLVGIACRRAATEG